VRTLFLLAMVAGVADACTADTNAGSTGDTSSATQPAATQASDSVTTPDSTLTTSAWTVTPSGIGPIRVGMTLEDLKRVGGDVKVPAGSAECAYVRPPSAPAGVSVMLARGQVTRVDVDSAGVRSDAGITVGDSASRVSQAYAGRVTTTPHKYVQGGQYLTVRSASPQDSTFRLLFETEGGRVTRFRSGRLPEVEWVERCG
jgi:hypothetical protein